jgi:hypothetical protein
MEAGPEDIVTFVWYYVPSLLWCVLAVAGISASAAFLTRRRPDLTRRRLILLRVAPLPLVCWVIYFATTAQFSFTLALLSSESSHVAEHAYFARFKAQVTTLGRAIRLVTRKEPDTNIRFYACCLIADMIQTNDDAVVEGVLQKIQNSDLVKTGFFGGNRLTEGFYIPGRGQVELPPDEIVRRRIHMLRAGSQSSQ